MVVVKALPAGKRITVDEAAERYIQTAQQFGHVGETGILFDHYRALATPQEAEQFWSIRPKASAKDIVETVPLLTVS